LNTVHKAIVAFSYTTLASLSADGCITHYLGNTVMLLIPLFYSGGSYVSPYSYQCL